ncbi:MAG: hypothetical protein K6T17_01195 [Fimbriimonadales bacterium]|nr:hypothetical protein [Fimbriimonadales bacterium]
MSGTRRRTRATTLVELLITAAFLGYCATSVITATAATYEYAATARNRLIALSLAETRMAEVQAQARTAPLTTGITEQTLTGTGIPKPVTVTTNITNYGTLPNLFEVVVSVRWEPTLTSGATFLVEIASIVRAPDA